MSKPASSGNPATKPRDWDRFWSVVWTNIFHGLGIVVTLGLVLLIGGCIIEDIWRRSRQQSSVPSPTPPISETPSREAIQANFNKLLFAAPKPCAVRNKGISNLSDCPLFGIRLGMTLDDVRKAIDGSGYFARSPHWLERECATKSCGGRLYQSREGFSITVEFVPRFLDDKTLLSAQAIRLTFGPDGVYFDPDSLRAMLVRMIGPPDSTAASGDLTWDGNHVNGMTARAYFYSGKFWAVLERPAAPSADGAVTKTK